ncbi:hypothetical protein D3C80_1403780 [compost metagenome]
MAAGFQCFPVVNVRIPEGFDKSRGGFVIHSKHQIVIGIGILELVNPLLFTGALWFKGSQVDKTMPAPQQQAARILIVVEVITDIRFGPLFIFCLAGQVS